MQKLFIPGPTHVRRAILEAQAVPMIGHRSDAMKALLADVLPGVKECLGTSHHAVVLSSSSTAAMEQVGRSVCRPGGKLLHLVNGNFSLLWWELSKACGLDAIKEEKPWGEAWDEASTRAALQKHGKIEALFVTHCETSTGALADVAGVVRAVRALCPEALVCLDVTSTACGMPVDFDAQDLDVALGGVQKCWALPPALTLAAVSDRALARMKEVPGRGYTQDLKAALEFQDGKGMTATTPSIPVMQALRRQLADIRAAGGFPARYAAHQQMQRQVLDWAAGHGLSILAREGFRSPTVTSIACEGRFVVDRLVEGYASAGYYITGGYGKTKDTHWRIGHMGDHTPRCVAELLKVTDAILARIGPHAAAGRA